MTGPVEDLLEVAAIFVAVERESRERRRIFLFSFLKSRVWLCNLANMASLELCIYRVVKGEKVKGGPSGKFEFSRYFHSGY